MECSEATDVVTVGSRITQYMVHVMHGTGMQDYDAIVGNLCMTHVTNGIHEVVLYVENVAIATGRSSSC